MDFVQILNQIAEARVKGTMIPVVVYILSAIWALGFVSMILPSVLLLISAVVVTAMAMVADWAIGYITFEYGRIYDLQISIRQFGLTLAMQIATVIAMVVLGSAWTNLLLFSICFDLILGLAWLPGVIYTNRRARNQ